jgi:acyl-coenzyme A synthetase/AMP-(fatty) acid ligase
MKSIERTLLADRDPEAPFAWRGGVPVNAGQFFADVFAQAEALSDGDSIVNLCLDRYRFAVGFVAALVRGRTSLFPPNTLPETLTRLREACPSLIVLSDDPSLGLEGWTRAPVVEAWNGGTTTSMPVFAESLPAACLLTSGSTGTPQPHIKHWGTLVRNVEAASADLAHMLGLPGLFGLNIVATVPPQHSYGLESSVLLALLGGAAFDAGRPFYPADIAQSLACLPRPRALVTTPFHLKSLLLSGVPLPPVDLVLSATAPLSPQLASQSECVLGGPLIEIYGCTEAGQVALRRTSRGELWRTMGEVRLRSDGNGDAGRTVAFGGHVEPPVPLADVLQLHDDRHFALLGRANDVMHVAGKRTSLSHLNYHLNCIEGVEDGAFWLPPEAVDGVVRPVAFVVAPTLTAAQVIAGLRPRIEAIFVPRRVVHVSSLPREATGKLTEKALRTLAHSQLGLR